MANLAVSDAVSADYEIEHPPTSYKGGKSPDSAVLTGFIETTLDKSIIDESDDRLIIDDKFFAKRRVGGKKINDREIAGWKEVPTLLDWDSTYRHSEWKENLEEIFEEYEDGGLSNLLIKDPDNKAEMKHNHAICAFVNSFLVENNFWKNNNWLFNTDQLLDLMKDKKSIKEHAKQIYINDEYDEDDKIVKVHVDDSWFYEDRHKYFRYNEKEVLTYEQLVDVWFDYLELVEKMKVFLIEEYGNSVVCIDPQHRWKEHYTNKMLAKLKDLQDSRFGEMSGAIITLTTYQDKLTGDLILPDEFENKHRGPSWFEAMERLKRCLDLTINTLRTTSHNRELEFSYIWVFECHKTGYPHVHLAVFGDMAEFLHCYKHNPDIEGRDQCDRYHRNTSGVWNQNYNYKCQRARTKDRLEYKHDLGMNGVATDITVRLNESSHAINNVSNYLAKYFGKNFGEIKSEYVNEDLSDKQWGTLVYNSAMWLTGYRTWGTSRDVGEVMKTERHESEKSFKNLGGELTNRKDVPYEELLGKADKEFRERVRRRDLLREAIQNRKDIWFPAA